VYGRLPATIGSGVTLDTATVPPIGAASYHFSGTGGLTVPSDPALQFTGGFTVTGSVRFDRLDAPQILIEKAGAFALTLTVDGGAPQLELAVVSGGVRRVVRSTQALAAATWYHVAAGVDAGRLHVTLDEGAHVQRGDPSGPPDVLDSPLLIGSTLVGHLQHLDVYDLTAPLLATFEDGSTERSVTLDDEGRADVTILSTGALVEPVPAPVLAGLVASGALTATPAPPAAQAVPDAAFIGPRGVVVTVTEGFDAALAQTPADVFFLETGARLRQCGDGLATGEGEGGLAMGCDLTAGLVAVLTIPLALRDMAVVSTHFAEGKPNVGDYITGTVSVVVIAATAIPVLRTIVRAIQRTRLSKVELATIKSARAAVRDIARTGTSDIPAERIIRVLADEPALAETFLAFAKELRHPDLAFERLRRLSRLYGDDDIVRTVLELATKVKPQSIEMLLTTVDRIGVPFTKPVLEGLAFFMERASTTAADRVAAYWKVFDRAPDPTKRFEVFTNTFTWIREAELNGAATRITNWNFFLQTSFKKVSDSPAGLNAAAGAYQELQHLAKDLNWSTAIREVQSKVQNGARVVDVILDFGDGVLTRREIKNLLPTSEFSKRFKAEVTADIDNAMKEAIQLTGLKLGPRFEAELITQLQHVQYLFRGDAQQMRNIVGALRGRVREVLGPAHEHLEFYISTLYSGRTLPF
jgi:hypothetical protein